MAAIALQDQNSPGSSAAFGVTLSPRARVSPQDDRLVVVARRNHGAVTARIPDRRDDVKRTCANAIAVGSESGVRGPNETGTHVQHVLHDTHRQRGKK